MQNSIIWKAFPLVHNQETNTGKILKSMPHSWIGKHIFSLQNEAAAVNIIFFGCIFHFVYYDILH